ncbi:MAG TPA: PAS domain S-box protein, partial [Anaerolineales bacterium]|nr:PAS domain S-box protein [Anaerolineales bacterium]
MKKPIHILIAEDSPTDAKLARRAIRKVLKNCEFEVVETRADFLRALETFRPDVILSDYSLPSFDGMKALKLARKHAPLTPLIIWSGSISEDIAVDCMKAGANNYVLKENLKRLGPAVLHALEERELLLARKQAEEALQNSEKRFRALIENGLDDISLLAADGSLLWESPSAIRNLGYIEGEFLGRNIFELMHPDDLEWTSNLFAKLVQEPGSRQTGIFRLHHFDATWHWVEAIATNMLNEPSVNAIVINYRDITERKQAEDTLRDREQGFRSITEDMTELICRFLPDGTLTYVNNVYCRYYGKSREELIGTNFITTAPVDLPQKHTDYFKSFSLEHPIDTFEQYDVLPNGEKRYREWVDRGIFDEWGHLIEIQSTGRDITARKQAEEALRESENRYRTLVETQTEFIVRWKSDSVRTFANKSYCDYFGLTPEEAISNSFIPLVYEQDRPNVEKKIQRLLSGEASVETEIHRVIRPDGKIGWQEWTDQAIHDKDGQLVEFQSVGRDITSRKQAEVERQVLLEIMQGLANADDLQEFLKLVHHSIAKVIYAENFFVVLYQPHSGLFEEIYSVDQFDPPAAPSKLEK